MIDLPVGNDRPGDERGFLHKSKFGKFVGGVVKRAIPAVGIASTVVSTVRSLGRKGASRTATARPNQFSRAESQRGADFKFGGEFGLNLSNGGGGGACPDGLFLASDGHCVAPGSGHARSHGLNGAGAAATGGGNPVLGLYGAGVTPGSRIIDRAVCGKKMQLGDDGICYNKSQISNKQRMWPAGRKPLLTGGDMRAISIASRAGKRMDGATARLRKLGMMKKAPTSRAPKAPTQHQRLLEAHATK